MKLLPRSRSPMDRSLHRLLFLAALHGFYETRRRHREQARAARATRPSFPPRPNTPPAPIFHA